MSYKMSSMRVSGGVVHCHINGVTLQLKEESVRGLALSEIELYVSELYREKYLEKQKPFAFEKEDGSIKVFMIARNELTCLEGTMMDILTQLENLCKVQRVESGVLYTKDVEFSLRFKPKYFNDGRWRKTFYNFCLRATIAGEVQWKS